LLLPLILYFPFCPKAKPSQAKPSQAELTGLLECFDDILGYLDGGAAVAEGDDIEATSATRLLTELPGFWVMQDKDYYQLREKRQNVVFL
jgi:hypothetical protein